MLRRCLCLCFNSIRLGFCWCCLTHSSRPAIREQIVWLFFCQTGLHSHSCFQVIRFVPKQQEVDKALALPGDDGGCIQYKLFTGYSVWTNKSQFSPTPCLNLGPIRPCSILLPALYYLTFLYFGVGLCTIQVHMVTCFSKGLGSGLWVSAMLKKITKKNSVLMPRISIVSRSMFHHSCMYDGNLFSVFFFCVIQLRVRWR